MAKLVTRREARNRRLKFQIFAGMFDLLGTLAGVLVILACIVLLNSLITWIIADGKSTFATLFEMISDAIITPQ